MVNATSQTLYPRKWPGTYRIGGWVSPGTDVDGYRKSRPPPHQDVIFWRIHTIYKCDRGSCNTTSRGHMRARRPGVGDTRFAANDIRIWTIFQTFAGLCIMYVCMVCVCVLCAHARVYTKHPLTHPFPVPSNYKFYVLPMREPNAAFYASRFMTANHPRSCV